MARPRRVKGRPNDGDALPPLPYHVQQLVSALARPLEETPSVIRARCRCGQIMIVPVKYAGQAITECGDCGRELRGRPER